VAVAAYVLTIVNPDKVPAVNGAKADKSSKDASLLNSAVMDDVSKTEPEKLLLAGKKDAAIAQGDKDIAVKPYDVRTLMSVGNVYCDVPDGDKNKGIAYLRKSVALCPQSRYVRLNFARHLVKAKKFDDAVVQYELMEKNAPDDWFAPRMELADLYLVKNEMGKAIDVLRRVMQSDTKNGAAQERLGLAMARNNDDKEGFEEFSKGFALRQVANQLNELNAYLARFDNNKEKAEADLSKAVKDNPESPDNVILLGELYLLENKTQAAKDLLATN
jgi:tetratricopeptide (TPR) repeat protein